MGIGESASVGATYLQRPPQVETPENVSLQQSARQQDESESLQTQQAESQRSDQQQGFLGSSTADANRNGRAFQVDLSV